jgi:hypothetical protein
MHPLGNKPGTPLHGELDGPQSTSGSLHAVEKRNVSSPCRESKYSPAVQLVVRRYTD